MKEEFVTEFQPRVNVDEFRPPKEVSKSLQFDQHMSLSEVDALVYRMLKDPFSYTRSIESIVYIRNLNFGLLLLKTKTLLYQPDSFFSSSREEEDAAIQDPRHTPCRNERGRPPETYYKLSPRFFERFDLTRLNLDRNMLIWWLKYYSAQSGFLVQLHQENFRKTGHRCLRFYCEYKKKNLPNAPQVAKNGQFVDDEDEVFIEDDRFLPVQNCQFKLIYRCEIDKSGRDKLTGYELYSFYPYHNQLTYYTHDFDGLTAQAS